MEAPALRSPMRASPARRVEALLVDSGNPQRLFAGVVNDKSYGGAFVSSDGGAHWEQISEGLEGRDLFALAESPDGTILAGTNHGLFALDSGDSGFSWTPRNKILNAPLKAASATPQSAEPPPAPSPAGLPRRFMASAHRKRSRQNQLSRFPAASMRSIYPATPGWPRPLRASSPARTRARAGRAAR